MLKITVVAIITVKIRNIENHKSEDYIFEISASFSDR